MKLTEEWFQSVIDQAVDDVELVLLEEGGSKRQRILRLYIDHPTGVNHELCTRVSAAVEQALDESDAIDGAYSLEVSSPGIERPLRKLGHFEAQLGKNVYVKTKVPVEGAKVWQGRLVEVGPEEIVVEESGRQARIRLSDIGAAHLRYDF